ncbi:helix-turn-helix domain-containing protein [Puia dinghuensis]|nr:AraC family transcriptional regulator [Puia dinghuensis]
MKTSKADIPKYDLDHFRPVHRQEDDPSVFGCNSLPRSRFIPGFELYSSMGLVHSVGPLRSEFYRVSITVSGKLDMQIGLERYRHQDRTICFTYPNQIFSKTINANTLGYYLLFKADFLDEVLPAGRLPGEFPFLSTTGVPLFQVSVEELAVVVDLVKKMDVEVREDRRDRARAVQLYLYLLLLEARRSYERQQLDHPAPVAAGHGLVARFQKLVGEHFLAKRQVADYARLLAVSANHLNRVVKEVTGRTASDSIREMLGQEAKSLLRYTDNSISEIAYRLDFSDPASFNRFFKTETGETPLVYRNRNK